MEQQRCTMPHIAGGTRSILGLGTSPSVSIPTLTETLDGHTAVAQVLVAAGLDPGTSNKAGDTTFDLAKRAQNNDKVVQALNGGPDVVQTAHNSRLEPCCCSINLLDWNDLNHSLMLCHCLHPVHCRPRIVQYARISRET